MFAVGEIIKIYSPTAGKVKYHLCVCLAAVPEQNWFLFINSGNGYEADYVLDDGAIGCLPKSPTGKSVNGDKDPKQSRKYVVRVTVEVPPDEEVIPVGVFGEHL